MEKKILIAFTTNSGSTEDVAQFMAEEMRQCGAAVEVRRLEEVASLDGYAAVIVGAPMILGWSRSALRFVKAHQQALSRVPVAYFMTAMSLTQTPETGVAAPVYVDPGLAKPPQRPGRLSLRERYASVPRYVGPALEAAPQCRPVSVGLFKGKLELFRLKFPQMLFVMLVVRAQPGDFRDWDAMRAWAVGLLPQLTGQPAGSN